MTCLTFSTIFLNTPTILFHADIIPDLSLFHIFFIASLNFPSEIYPSESILFKCVIFDSDDNQLVLRKGGIEELVIEKFNDNKIYDLMGKELREVPVGVIYIRNNKLYIKTK